MSLINEVLRDLDARHAADGERAGLAQSVKALPPTRAPFWTKLTWPLFAAVSSAAIVWLLIVPSHSPAPMPSSVPTPIQAPLAEPAPPVAAVASPPAAAMAPELPAEAVPPAQESVPLKLAVAMAEVHPPKPAAPLSASPVVKAPERAASTAVTPKGLLPTSSANAPAQISKQPTGGSGTLNEQAEAEYRRGLNAARRGEGSEASDAYRAAIKLQNNHVLARQALLSLLVEQRQWAAVEVLAMDGLGMMPNRHDWALLAARVQFERGEVGQALDTMSLHASYARGNADYQVFYALLLQRANRHAEAVNCYQIALAINPAEGRWWYGMARALEADHRDPEARQAYEKARDSGNLPPELAQAVERRLR